MLNATGFVGVLNALLVLRGLLPTPRRSYVHEARQPLHGRISDIVHIIPVFIFIEISVNFLPTVTYYR